MRKVQIYVGFVLAALVALATMGLAVPVASAAMDPAYCVEGFVGSYHLGGSADCSSTATTYFGRMSGLTSYAGVQGARGDAGMADRAFHGWGRASSYPCNGTMPNPCASHRGPTGAVDAWQYGAAGWTHTTIADGTWLYLQRYSGAWEWAYSGGHWYAILGDDLEGYCGTDTTYSNCVAKRININAGL